jgi:hypothetical protein
MLSQLLLPVLRERFLHRSLTEGQSSEEPCAVFPGIHPGIHKVSIYDDGSELTVCVEPLTHGHFDNSTEGLSEAENAQRSVDQVVEFLENLFADRIVV